MAKVESIRLVPPANGAAGDPSWPVSGRHAPELLDVLAAGDPAAFATDSRERIVFWNRGAATLVGRRAEEAMGRHCYEVLGGRDVFGNRFCYANCPLASMSRSGEAPRAFELRLPGPDGNGGGPLVHVTTVRLPGPRPDLFTMVHILSAVDEEARLTRALARLSPQATTTPVAAPPPAAVLATDEDEGAPAAVAAGPDTLTPREREILGWIAAGLQNKEIAQRLGLSLATVRNHIHNTLEKLEVHSKLEAVSLAYRNGWVTSAGPAARG